MPLEMFDELASFHVLMIRQPIRYCQQASITVQRPCVTLSPFPHDSNYLKPQCSIGNRIHQGCQG